ncbi:hypothetical protein [Marinimicrobium sp. ABcell2]|uniref:hypothetical protein n=1 Tax=Marinimicrobium sp. ABcell2 TaxID=3069751 RepID=UPI0027B3F70C|nr:hypothetical protein [Marinimicrobium sp. ABcell2]MDQ2075202.1 hypothetical protein [Marinimicrobium sp. ABcell2]
MKHLITIAILVAAIAVASAGHSFGFAVLVVIGILLEGVFWLRVFKKRNPSPTYS